MVLNQVHLVVHDDEALAQFCADRNILGNFIIKRPSPNDDDEWVKGEGDRIPVQICLIH